MKYHVGDRVRIVDKWPVGAGQNSSGKMDHWLGKIMTVREIQDAYSFYVPCKEKYGMQEDFDLHERYGNGWHWTDKMISGLADSAAPAAQPAPEVREVHRAAKAGEWIKLVTDGGFDFAHPGEILPVCDGDPDGRARVWNKDHRTPEPGAHSYDSWTYLPPEYVVLEGYRPDRAGGSHRGA